MAVMLEMEMPKYCLETISENYRVVKICPIRELCIRKWGGYIGALNVHSDACPLVEIPPHGRLCDIDRMISESRKVQFPVSIQSADELADFLEIYADLDKSPYDNTVVVPASEEKTNG